MTSKPAGASVSRATRRSAKSKKAIAGEFPVVGIGASAGGLESFVQFLEHLPPDTGMAFVFVQHLSPEHESALSHILGRATAMTVREARHGLEIRPNEVYVIPPGSTMTLAGRRLLLSPRDSGEAPQLSIDDFFVSLAEHEQRAIGVVFSGNAADGTHGLEAIKAAGGVTFAQDKSAQYDSMPRNAIAAGCVDYVLPPAAVARELVRLAGHAYFQPGRSARAPAFSRSETGPEPRSRDSERAMTTIIDLVQKHSGIDFQLYKPNTIQRRISRRMLLRRKDSLEVYARFLSKDAAELKALCGDLLISVSSFFRDAAAFDFIKKNVFAAMIAERREKVRIWTIGCASGQEAYSLAMIFLEAAARVSHPPPRLQIFGTDLNETLLNRARRGLYPKSLMQGVSPARLKNFFVEEPGGYRVTKALRDMCIFGRQDILNGPPFSRMDFVSCRNLLIYIDPLAQKRVFPTLHYALRPGGHLFLGASESVGAFSNLFEAVDRRHKIFLRKSTPTPALALPLRQRAETDPDASQEGPPAFPASRPELQAHYKADRILMNQFVPPAVLVDAGLNVLEFRGTTDPYLTSPRGKASFHLLKLAREWLVMPLRSALEQARRRNQPAHRDKIQIGRGATQTVDLLVIPLTNLKERFFLVVFGHRRPPPTPLAAGSNDIVAPGEAGQRQLRRRNLELERELREMRDYLHSLQQQHDMAQDQLQASIEEAQSTNEELQTVNEELETSKEELESGNEELITVNEEMVFRVGELNRLNSDLTDFHVSADTAILMLNRELCVERFTPAAEKLFNLLPADVGRPVRGIRHNLEFEDLEGFARGIVARRTTPERLVRDKDGRWHLLRARPRVAAGQVVGAVLVLFDVDVVVHRAGAPSSARLPAG